MPVYYLINPQAAWLSHQSSESEAHCFFPPAYWTLITGRPVCMSEALQMEDQLFTRILNASLGNNRPRWSSNRAIGYTRPFEYQTSGGSGFNEQLEGPVWGFVNQSFLWRYQRANQHQIPRWKCACQDPAHGRQGLKCQSGGNLKQIWRALGFIRLQRNRNAH